MAARALLVRRRAQCETGRRTARWTAETCQRPHCKLEQGKYIRIEDRQSVEYRLDGEIGNTTKLAQWDGGIQIWLWHRRQSYNKQMSGAQMDQWKAE
jgi:hypothetical protein